MSSTSSISIAADSHVGLVRELNEDSFAYWYHPDAKNFLVIIADGIGGHDNGDLASSLCIKTLLTEWRNNKLFDCESSKKMRSFLEGVLLRSNETIHNLNVIYDVQHPMGTTVVVGVFMPKLALVAHAGDSRCYRVYNHNLERLTRDHSIVEELVKRGLVKPEDAKNHPFSHIISRSVGPCPELEPEISQFKRNKGDRFMFCTDGLVNHVSDAIIFEMLENSESADDSVKRLLYASLKGGGEDNVTVISIFT